MLTPRQQHCLEGIGIRYNAHRSPAAASDETREAREKIEAFAREIAAPPVEPPVEKPVKAKAPAPILDDWDSINQSIHGCEACELSQSCTQKVPGVGNRQAEVMIIGEGPGHDEDLQGEPFVGRSGQLLDKMLAAIGLSRSQVFITNIVKCRPPNNRDPHADEVASCEAFLAAQIEQISPKAILAVGRISAQHLLNSSSPVGKLLDQIHQLPGSDIPVKVTYHPAYLLRTPSAKAIAWKDLKTLHKMLNG